MIWLATKNIHKIIRHRFRLPDFTGTGVALQFWLIRSMHHQDIALNIFFTSRLVWKLKWPSELKRRYEFPNKSSISFVHKIRWRAVQLSHGFTFATSWLKHALRQWFWGQCRSQNASIHSVWQKCTWSIRSSNINAIWCEVLPCFS